MNERGKKEYGVILAFDVAVTKEAREMAAELGVTIFTADIIYHLFDSFTNYIEKVLCPLSATFLFEPMTL